MAIKYGFVDGVLYGTDDINDITGGLVGAGVAPFTAKDSYDVTELNKLTEAVVEAGVQLGGCRCSVSGIGSREMTVNVAQGIVFFSSGVRLEIDSEGYSFSVESNQEGYVFAHFNMSLQKAEILFEEELRTDGESVLLAKILKNGYVEDRRVFAQSKIATLGKNATIKLMFQRVETPVLYEGRYIVSKIAGVDLRRFNYAVAVACRYHGDVNLQYFPDNGYYSSFFDLNKGEQDFILYNSGDFVKSRKSEIFYKSNEGYEYSVGIADGELCILCKCDEKKAVDAVGVAYGCTVCLM